MSWFVAADGKRRRSPQFSDAAIQFCLTIKNPFGLALRQATAFVQSLLALSGLVWTVSDFSTLCRRKRNLDVQVAYRLSRHLLLDSTGIKFLAECGWKCKKHGPENRRQWRKLHICIDAQTLQCCRSRWNKFSPRSRSDSDRRWAYDTQLVHAAVMQRYATPIIPRKMPGCGDCRLQALLSQALEKLEWLPPAQLE